MNIKLVIWDLDETFWSGTLSEEGATPKDEFIELVKGLSYSGIINSISSKNDYEKAKSKLIELDVWDFFVFNKIGWYSKGNAIKDTLIEMGLRPVNVLFLDDNHLNLQEVSTLLPNINVMHPKDFSKEIYVPLISVSQDSSLTRLKQYKVLETKKDKRKEYETDMDFLLSCDIHVSIRKANLENINRIHELISRANQLNFTKSRDDKVKISFYLKYHECYEVHVSDAFGQYGLVGFVVISLDSLQLIHFCFSCRTINLGVEQYVYSKLNSLKLEIVEPVVSKLKHSYIPEWISDGVYVGLKCELPVSKVENILFKGGCDLSLMLVYMNLGEKVKEETNGITSDGLPYHAEHTSILLGEATTSEHFKFLPSENINTEVFKQDNSIVIYSLLMDYTQDIYKLKSDHNKYIPFGGYNIDACKNNKIEAYNSSLRYLKDNYINSGQISVEKFKLNLSKILDEIGPETKLILINGAEIDDPSNPKLLPRHIEINAALSDFVNGNDKRVKLLDVRDIVKSTMDITDNARHYKPEIYKKMADKLIAIIDSDSVSRLSVFQRFNLATFILIKKIVKFFMPLTIVNYLRDIK
jgi:FkbH-like protein